MQPTKSVAGSATKSRAVLSFFMLVLAALPAQAQERNDRPVVRVGFVADKPDPRSEQLRRLTQQELLGLTRNDFEVRFPDAVNITADGTAEDVDRAVRRLLNDAQVDLVITLDFLGSQFAASGAPWSTPVIASFIIDAQLQGAPYEAGSSGITDLSYLTIPAPITQDLLTFRRITSFESIEMFVPELAVTEFPEFVERLQREVSDMGVNARVIPVGSSAAKALNALSDGAEAVYIMPLGDLAPGEFERLAQGLIERRLPSFALAGERDVAAGALASLNADSTPRLARRVALHAQRILLGDEAGTLSVHFTPSEELVINIRTMRAIGIVPPLGVLLEAKRLFDAPEGVEREVTLQSAMEEAGRLNLNLAIQDRTVAAGAENIRLARSNLLPQLAVSAGGVVIDASRGRLGSQPQRTLEGKLALEQLIYSDSVLADLSIQRSLQDARVYDRDSLGLDVALEAAEGLLRVLAAKTLERIRQENIDITRSSLRVAAVREQIGAAGPGERLRLESELAQRRAEGIEAYVQRRTAEIALNQVLNRPLDEEFLTPEARSGGMALIEENPLADYFKDIGRFRRVVDYLVQEAFAASPELQSLDANIAAQERLLLTRLRAFYLPSVALQAEVSTNIFEGGAGANSDLTASLTDFPWSIGVFATLPLFEGKARVAERQQAFFELDGLRSQRMLLALQIDQNVRTQAEIAFGSYATIAETEVADVTATRSLELVSDSYAEGAVAVIDLLEAQNRKLVSELNVTTAIYSFLIDLKRTERAMGGFLQLLNPDERAAVMDRLKVSYQDLEDRRE